MATSESEVELVEVGTSRVVTRVDRSPRWQSPRAAEVSKHWLLASLSYFACRLYLFFPSMESSGPCLLCDEEPFILSPTPSPRRSSSPPPNADEDRDTSLRDILQREHQYAPRRGESWMAELLSVACLSIASKMDEVSIPSLYDPQVATAIQEMELTVLERLDWRLACITPFSYVEVLTWGFEHARTHSCRLSKPSQEAKPASSSPCSPS
ncbi:hypothetical protein BHE74_00020512 [Ensete ventricosum]|nr:hypothetical protein GW17_00051126 [Ensete ventricosum]RWW71710.1 hypothetical protein BHE74_00020512 [Ensete ventricosum]